MTMDYGYYENSEDENRPIEIYVLRGTGIPNNIDGNPNANGADTWAFTSSNYGENLDFDGKGGNQLYIILDQGPMLMRTPLKKHGLGAFFANIPLNRGPIKRSTFENSQDNGKGKITVTLDSSSEAFNQYKGDFPDKGLLLDIYRVQLGDAEVEIIELGQNSPYPYQIIWSGRVTDVKFTENEVVLGGEPNVTSLSRNILRLYYQIGCPHAFGGYMCGAYGSADLSTGGEGYFQVTSVSGVNLIVPELLSYPPLSCVGSLITIYSGKNTAYRSVVFQDATNSDQISINMPCSGLVAGDSCNFTAGCDHTLNTCKTRFNNIANYGGQPFYPDRNPMVDEVF